MLSNGGGILKSGWVKVDPANTRIIDTNARAEARLREMAVELEESAARNLILQMVSHRESAPWKCPSSSGKAERISSEKIRALTQNLPLRTTVSRRSPAPCRRS